MPKKAGKPNISTKSYRGKSPPSSTSKKKNASKVKPNKGTAPSHVPKKKRALSAQPPPNNNGSKKGTKQRQSSFIKAEVPFPLYRDVKNATVSEGLDSIVNLLRGRKNIVVLNGAGISVSCGIPDFRSKGSGLYSTLDTQDLGLSCPEELFDWEVFREDPRPFYKFARNLYFPLGSGDNAQRVRPSDSHKLLALLEQKKMLLRVYTQNIDGLEQVAGVSPKKMVYAHGSLQFASCCKCRRKVSAKEIEPAILKRVVPLCQGPAALGTKRAVSPLQIQPSRARKRPRGEHRTDFQPVQEEGKPLTCNGVLKPGVTFFGEALNDTVRKSLEADRNKVDALVVIGTSLSVAPMSKVISYLPSNIPRILINRTIVHPKNSSSNINNDKEDQGQERDSDDDTEKDFRYGYIFDAYLLGFCDDVTRLLAKRLFADDVADTTPVATKDEQSQLHTRCQLLANVRERDALKNQDDNNKQSCNNVLEEDDVDDDSVELEAHKAELWKFCAVPPERVVLFPGAEPTSGNGYGDDGEDDNSELTFREIAHCDGCTKRIEKTIYKCNACFDYDLCPACFPKLSKTHFGGGHVFTAEPAAVVDV